MAGDRAESDKREAERMVRAAGPLVLLSVAGGSLLAQSRLRVVLGAVGNDGKKAATFLAAAGGMAGAAEFAMVPIVGKLADRIGRLPLLTLLPMSCGVLRGLVFASPNPAMTLRLVRVERMLSMALVSSWFTALRASFSDTIGGSSLAVAMASLMTWVGAGGIVGPFLEAAVIRRLGPRYNFLIVSMINFAVGMGMAARFRETLRPEDRKQVNLASAVNPFSFLELFRVGKTARALMVVLLLQQFGERPVTQDMNQVTMRKELGWSAEQIARYSSANGLAQMLGSKTLKWTLANLGEAGHTTMSNFTMAASFALQGLGRAPAHAAMTAALFFSMAGGRNKAAVETALIAHGSAGGLGKGQITAGMANFKAVASIVGPPLSAKVYNWGSTRGLRGAPYLVIAAGYLLAEVVFQMVASNLRPQGKKDQ
eukprot:TRINITY_DN1688_c0_g1_i1.p1 TRINITY_DN1688_c0_g1~~TRINITY_DN1688_c0_g1_i1.p1  ORF type:complete len:448 (+),score=149.39 TRINITY_DN1688_c0_g1_i1:69-1346(+)